MFLDPLLYTICLSVPVPIAEVKLSVCTLPELADVNKEMD
jgi:hypothetical protein